MQTTLKIEFPCTMLKKDNKAKKKDNKLTEIVRAVSGLLNTKGGLVVLYSTDGPYSADDVDDITRRLEQKLASLVEDLTASDMFIRETVQDSEISFRVKVLPSLSQPCTVNYNFYYPSETQVIKVPSSVSVEKVHDMLKRNSRKRKPHDHLIIGCHKRHFIDRETVALRESKNTQLKKLKDEKSKQCDLVSRMLNNKLTSYVSAFANGEGGHIYYGIRTDENGNNVAEGEVVQDRDKIIQEVDKAIKRMSWPEEGEVPERGKHWEISFEPVSGVNVSDKFIIVITIAPHSGGVFAEQPESYQVVDGKVVKLEYLEWRKKLYQHRISNRSHVIEMQSSVGRCSWSSPDAYDEDCRINDKLVQLRNDGDKSGFDKYVAELQESSNFNARIISQQQQAGYFIRGGYLRKAEELLEKNKRLLITSADAAILEGRWLYWMCTAKRSQPGKLRESEELFTSAIQKMQLLPACLVVPWLFVQKARVLETKLGKQCECEEARKLIDECKASYLEALREASVLQDSLGVVALKQRVHISLARVFLGSFRYRDQLTRKEVCTESDLLEADKMLEIVDRSCHRQGWPMTRLCKCEYLLVRSEQDIRNWERLRDSSYLNSAGSKCKKALKIAKKINFNIISRYGTAQLNYLKGQKRADIVTSS